MSKKIEYGKITNVKYQGNMSILELLYAKLIKDFKVVGGINLWNNKTLSNLMKDMLTTKTYNCEEYKVIEKELTSENGITLLTTVKNSYQLLSSDSEHLITLRKEEIKNIDLKIKELDNNIFEIIFINGEISKNFKLKTFKDFLTAKQLFYKEVDKFLYSKLNKQKEY